MEREILKELLNNIQSFSSNLENGQNLKEEDIVKILNKIKKVKDLLTQN